MGANLSGCVSDADGDLEARLDDIPESCVALVLMYLDPPDICKLARLNHAFHGASTADFVWESKLPSNYKFIIEEVLEDESLMDLAKRDVYARLCRHNLFDKGKKVVSFSLSWLGLSYCLSLHTRDMCLLKCLCGEGNLAG